MKSTNEKTTFSMTSCAKTGIKINKTNNDYTRDPFANYNPTSQQRNADADTVPTSNVYDALDLNIEHYSREDFYKLFGFKTSIVLTEEHMKTAKKIVLKTHPDKSRLDNKYFVFFSKAYQKLKDIYEFQNKIHNKSVDTNEYFDPQNGKVLDKMFDMKTNLKDTKQFNSWFNDQFDKHRLEDPVEHGYGDWLKSDDDIIYTPQNINKDTMAREMDKRKKNIQALTPYKGVGDICVSSSAGGSALMEYNSNFSSGSLFSGGNGGGMGYTDLRQAYVESVIPVSEDDLQNIPTFSSIDAYKRHRDSVDTTPLSTEQSMHRLYQQDKQTNEESAALAFYYAQQSDKAKRNNDIFWSGLKQITNK